jgi:hypothetical protein
MEIEYMGCEFWGCGGSEYTCFCFGIVSVLFVFRLGYVVRDTAAATRHVKWPDTDHAGTAGPDLPI